MDNRIPKIIHQIWSDKYKPLPKFFTVLAETWKEHHPDWEYVFWDEERMHNFVKMEFPEYYDFWNSLPFDVQRWDSIRYLILYRMGGMYLDFDFECWENVEPLLQCSCNIALGPDTHRDIYEVNNFISIGLIACVPEHVFIKHIINKVFSRQTLEYEPTAGISIHILNTTGPLMVSRLYDTLLPEEKKEIYLIPAKYAIPFDSKQMRLVKAGVESEELEACLQEAYAVHYYSNAWVGSLKTYNKRNQEDVRKD